MNALKTKTGFLVILICLLGPLFYSGMASAQENIIRKRFQENVVPGQSITSIRKTPYSGLYEVRVGSKIVYTDSKARFLFIGNVIDINTGQNHTQTRIDEITKISFSELPLKQAIRKVNGKGERVIAVFSDPNCGYCKRLEHMLKDIDNLTVYVFPLNILSEKSETISRNIWCSPDRNQAWDNWMTKGELPKEAKSDCDYSGAGLLSLAKKLDITGTPVIFLGNGSRIIGMPSKEAFLGALSDAQ